MDTMNRRFRGALLPAVALAAVLAAVPAAAPAADFEWSKAIPAGKAIEIKSVNGDITATLATGGAVEVKATKRWKRSDPDEVTIEVIEHEGGVTVCARYPSPHGKENVCAPGDKGHMSTEDNDVRVDFVIRVPAGVELIARTVNGEVEATGLRGPVQARTVNGSVRVSTSGHASAETVNGSIVASLGSAAGEEALSFSTVNGGIRLTLPPDVNAVVHAQTVNGAIETDFPVTVRGKFSRRRLDGTIGKGGRRIELESVNGTLELKSASS